MTAETFQQARRPEQKLQRQDAILSAARELALRDGVRNVSLAGIAARSASTSRRSCATSRPASRSSWS